jgi:hypothetical protein
MKDIDRVISTETLLSFLSKKSGIARLATYGLEHND